MTFLSFHLCLGTVHFRESITQCLRVPTYIFLLRYDTLQTIKELLWQTALRPTKKLLHNLLKTICPIASTSLALGFFFGRNFQTTLGFTYKTTLLTLFNHFLDESELSHLQSADVNLFAGTVSQYHFSGNPHRLHG